jgi:hypothetical protein
LPRSRCCCALHAYLTGVLPAAIGMDYAGRASLGISGAEIPLFARFLAVAQEIGKGRRRGQ